ncbi:PDZ domain-containing protein [Kribbella amoyensis]|uniref:PDZ domain-containing protein n=1 Tax=Kribbella amoyensis TaxID=996641 RepID=A0A561BJU4_9ACTN|nr:S1C family serine protease [Kribbella amoyensis]TWD79141.1 PDZ domain-containing protein [Kribbella amoyensis]
MNDQQQYGPQYGPGTPQGQPAYQPAGQPGYPPYAAQYGPWGGAPGGPFHQPPRRRKRLPLLIGSLGLAAVVVAGSLAWGIDQHEAANSAKLAQVVTPASVAAQVSPGLVDVNTVLGYEGARAAGTGIVLTSDGEILTNHHVIEGATQISVTDIGNGRTYQAGVVGYDSAHDIAVLKLKDASGLQTAKTGDSSKVAVGDQVVGIGNAGGVGGQPSYAAGQVTALNQAITATDEGGSDPENLTGLIATDANIQAGDSGGPLANASGEVIGVDTAGSGGNNGGNGAPGQTAYTPGQPGFGDGSGQGDGGFGDGSGNGGFGDGSGQGNGGFGQGDGGQSDGQGSGQGSAQGFAVPINQALSIVDQIEAGNGSSDVHIGETPMLGISVADTGSGEGAVVNDVLAGGKAAAAGLSAGDVITEVDGHQIDSPDALAGTLNQHHPGDKVSVTWTGQDGQQHQQTIELTTGPVR